MATQINQAPGRYLSLGRPSCGRFQIPCMGW